MVEVTGSRRSRTRQLAEELNKARTELAHLRLEKDVVSSNIKTMLTTLAQRYCTLAAVQTALLDQLETSEANPDQLHRLFELDHVITRLSRNSVSLLALAGSEPYRRPHTQPIALTENSPDPSTVAVAGRLHDDDLLLRIDDEGPVIDAQHLASLNARLAVSETVAVQDFAQMGLATVGVLAKQIGAVVEPSAPATGDHICPASVADEKTDGVKGICLHPTPQ